MDMAFDHCADNLAASRCALLENAAPDIRLAERVFAGVRMAAIDHERWLEAGFSKRLAGGSDVGRMVVCPVASPAKHDVAIWVSRSRHNARHSVLVDPKKAVRCPRGLHGVDCRLNAPVGAIFKSDRHREPACHFAMGLGFGSAGTDGRPAHQISSVLRNDRVKKFCADWEAEVNNIEEDFTCNGNPVGDIARIIEMGVVNEPFPACRRTGLFKIHPHHDEVAIGNFALHLGQPSRIVQSGLWIVNRTGTDNDQQAVIISAQDRPGCLTRPCNQAENTSGCGKLFFDASRRHQPRHSRNADILNRKAGYIRLRFISHKESP